MRQIVLSDLHLGSKNCRVKEILTVLQMPADRFILNGDIVNSVNFKRFGKLHWEALAKIRQLARSERAVLIQGNHDTSLEAATGIPVVPSVVFSNGDIRQAHKWIVLHGDFFDPTLNWPLITDVAEWCYQTAQAVHKKSARLAKRLLKKFGGVVKYVQHGAAEFAKQRNYAGIITGHTHFADDLWIDGVRYMNSGSWTEEPSHYIEVTDHSATLHQW